MRCNRFLMAGVAAVILITGCLAGAEAQEMPIRAVDGVVPQTGITVSGHAELKMKADVAYVTLTVQTSSREQTAAVAENATKATALVGALKASQIADQDIQTEDYTVSADYDNNANPPVLTGYEVSHTYQVTIHNLSKAGLIVDKATQSGATQVGDLDFELLDRDRAQGEALVQAVANAKSKADLAAGAAGVSVGRLISLTEGGASFVPQPIFARGMAMGPATQAPTTPISPQQITLTSDVTATYAIVGN